MYFKIAKFFLYLVPFTVIIVSSTTLFPFIVGKYAFFRTSVSLALIFFLLGLLLDKQSFDYNIIKDLLKSPLVIAVFAFVAAFLLACFFSINPYYSFWSNFERGEGGLQILYLGVFFFLLAVLLREEKDWQRLFGLSVLAAALVIFYGIGAHLKYIDMQTQMNPETGPQEQRGGIFFNLFKGFIGSSFNEPGFRFSGSLGNPAYTATYLIFALFYAGYLLLDYLHNKKQSKKQPIEKKNSHLKKQSQEVDSFSPIILLILAVIIFAVFFWLASTRGAFMGFVAAVLLASFYLALQYKRYRIYFLSFAVLVVFLVGILIMYRDHPRIANLPGARLFQISLSAKTWQDRVFVWKIAIDGFKERPIFGWGPENFLPVFALHFNTKLFNSQEGFSAWFDRAHSIYLDYLVEIGIIGLLSYLSIFAAFYWLLFKKQLRMNNHFGGSSFWQNLQMSFIFALPIAYLVQGIVLFEILPLYINIFLFLAFANYKLRVL
jgi:uncharacterized membrane protein YgcG